MFPSAGMDTSISEYSGEATCQISDFRFRISDSQISSLRSEILIAVLEIGYLKEKAQ